MPDMPRCATCKWWESGRDRAPDLIAFDERYNYCRLTELDYGEKVHPYSRAWAVDAAHHRALLATSADFGCVQHAPRKEPVDATNL